jgi:hypothetical protein
VKEWATGSLFLAGVLAVLYVYGLPLAGSLYRQARFAWMKRQAVRRLARALEIPVALLK